MKLKPDQEQHARQILKELPLFAGCSEEQIHALCALLDARDVAAGRVVLMDQEIGKTLYVIASGQVGVYKRVSGEKMQLATLAAPNFVGERTMFEESPASALVKTEEACTIFALERPAFDQLASRFPGIAELIRKNMETVRAQRLSPVKPSEENP
jgi:CRP-like cAMP-binding protein